MQSWVCCCRAVNNANRAVLRIGGSRRVDREVAAVHDPLQWHKPAIDRETRSRRQIVWSDDSATAESLSR